MTAEEFWTEGDTGEALPVIINPSLSAPFPFAMRGVIGDFSQFVAPLPEPTDRDADNVPSDRVRAYAVAIHEARVGQPISDDTPLCPTDDEEPCWPLARAVMAVADREQAEAWDAGYTVGNSHNGRRDANPYRAALRGPKPTEGA